MVGRRAQLGLVAAGGAVVLTLGVGLLRRATPSPPPVVERPIRTVTALGRLEPVSALRTIAAPLSGAGQPTLQALLVDRGDAVQAGQLLALLDNQPQLEAAVTAARAEVNMAR